MDPNLEKSIMLGNQDQPEAPRPLWAPPLPSDLWAPTAPSATSVAPGASDKDSLAQRISISTGRAMPKLPSGMSFLKPSGTTTRTIPPLGQNISTAQPTTQPFATEPTIPKITAPVQYAGIINQKAKEYGVPESVLTSLLSKESGFNPNASNINKREKSYGLAQINTNVHPVTPAQAKDPNFAIDFAAKRLAQMISKYGLYEGIQAYNTPGAVGSKELINYANKILTAAGLINTANAAGPSKYVKLGTPKAPPKIVGPAPTKLIPPKVKPYVAPKVTLPKIKPKPAPKKKTGKGGPGDYQNLPKVLSSLGNKTTDYGEQTRYEKKHLGLDFANEKGTPIKTPIAGRVTGVDTGHVNGEKGFGNRVEITDQKGNKHLFSHLNTVNVRPGQPVGPNAPVATMGDTGSSYSPTGGPSDHLDYRIVSAANKYINPYHYFGNKK